MTRPVKVFKYGEWDSAARNFPIEFRCLATFHQFSMDYEEFEQGAGNFATAIVELKDGTVDNVPVRLVQFTDKEAA